MKWETDEEPLPFDLPVLSRTTHRLHAFIRTFVVRSPAVRSECAGA